MYFDEAPKSTERLQTPEPKVKFEVISVPVVAVIQEE
jgi:hypothetical protein